MTIEEKPQSFKQWQESVHSVMGSKYFIIARLSDVVDYPTGWQRRTRKQKENARKNQLTIN